MQFETFYRQEFSTMVSLAYTICGDYQQGEDLAQEAMSRAHRNWPKVSAYERPGAWVRRVTINLSISRTARVRRELSALRKSARQSVPTPGSLAEDSLLAADHEVWQAVGKLAPRQRAAIAMFYQQDLSTADIADALGCSVSTATSHLNQARKRLANYLGEEQGEEQTDNARQSRNQGAAQ